MMGLEIILIIVAGVVGGFAALILLGFTASIIGGIVGGILSGGSYAYVERKEQTQGRFPPG